MNGDVPTTPVEAQVVACPKCGARFTFCRSPDPQIDNCGFECYSLKCEECNVPLSGILDPYDETLLFSQLEG